MQSNGLGVVNTYIVPNWPISEVAKCSDHFLGYVPDHYHSWSDPNTRVSCILIKKDYPLTLKVEPWMLTQDHDILVSPKFAEVVYNVTDVIVKV
jgi:hypothetical protein